VTYYVLCDRSGLQDRVAAIHRDRRCVYICRCKDFTRTPERWSPRMVHKLTKRRAQTLLGMRDLPGRRWWKCAKCWREEATP